MTEQELKENILSVSQLNRQARIIVEDHFQETWVMGEMSNFAHPRSGHWYFSLKDKSAQVRCAMFANRNRAVQMQPGDGQLVLIRGRVSLYEGRGEFQIIVDYMEPAGEGALRQAFDQLKIKLAAEGLFDADKKKPLPTYPKHCAVVTSPTGAALQDVLSVWQRRYPQMSVTVVPSLVQGADAESALVNALRRAESLVPDVILLTRGGGSLEDLWCFNAESLARQIVATSVPVVSAVGHEIDTTICDFVADVRAPTPSAAAELITPDKEEIHQTFAGYQTYLANLIRGYLNHQQLIVQNTHLKIKHPSQLIQQAHQRLDELFARVQTSNRHGNTLRRNRLNNVTLRLNALNQTEQIQRHNAHIEQLNTRLESALRHQLALRNTRLAQTSRMLHNLSPLPTLGRGFAIMRNDQEVVQSSVDSLEVGQKVQTLLQDGSIISTVEQINKDNFLGDKA